MDELELIKEIEEAHSKFVYLMNRMVIRMKEPIHSPEQSSDQKIADMLLSLDTGVQVVWFQQEIAASKLRSNFVITNELVEKIRSCTTNGWSYNDGVLAVCRNNYKKEPIQE